MQTTLTIINNPFNPRDKETKSIDAGLALFHLLDTVYEDIELVVSVNGTVTEDYTYIIKQGDNIGIVPVPKGGGGGKNIFRMVAMIALAIYAPALAAQFQLAAFGALGTVSSLAITTGIITMAGGMLINALLPPQTPDVSTNDSLNEVSPTYAFSGGSNAREAGSTLPIMLGKSKVTPPIIGSYLALDGDSQYLNVLMAVNDGLVDSITDIEVNGQSIDNFNDIEFYTTDGVANQAAIGNFRDSKTTVSLQRNLNEKDLSTSYTTGGNTLQELEVVVALTRGLYKINKKGKYVTRSVSYRIEYRIEGTTEWTVRNYNHSNVYKTSKRLSHRYKELPKGKYEVRVTRTSSKSTDTSVGDEFSFDYVNEVVYDDFTYPGVALLSVNALSTDQLNGGFPTINCVVDTTNTRAGKPKDNPAWACYDLLKREGIADSNIDLVKFQEWADYCDEKEYTVGLYLDSQQELQAALNLVSTLGRATVVQFGSVFAPLVDNVVEPSQSFIFTGGNIIKDSFEMTYIPYNERSNVIEVTYYDAEDSYKAKSVQVQSHDFDATSTEIKSSISLYGCTKRQMALNYAQHLLNKNRYISESVSFTADIDAVVCTVGDVIRVGVKTMTNTLADGRIVDADADTITLDNEVTLEAGESYEIQYRLKNDEVISLDIPFVTTTITTNVLDTPSNPNVPDKYDVYAIGKQELEATNLYRVMKISRANDMARKITAIEYNAAVYDDDVEVIVEPVDIAKGVSALTATEILTKRPDGTIDELLVLDWQSTSLRNTIYLDGAKIGISDTNSYHIINLLNREQTYTIKVDNEEIEHTFLGLSQVPPPVENLTFTSSNGSLFLKWDPSDEVDFDHYNVYYGGKVYSILQPSFVLESLPMGNIPFQVSQVDTTANESDLVHAVGLITEPSLNKIIDDTYGIEKAFRDGLMRIFVGDDIDVSEATEYDLWSVTLGSLTLAEYTYASKQLDGLSFDIQDGIAYKYYTNEAWVLCSKEQLLVIQRMLTYVSASALADGNVRVFNITPFVPYHVGDLWIDGNTIRTCTTSKFAPEDVFLNVDWGIGVSGDIPMAPTLENGQKVVDINDTNITDEAIRAGLNITPTQMGYHNGVYWQSRITSDGKFKFANDTNTKFIEYDGDDLIIQGRIVAQSGSNTIQTGGAADDVNNGGTLIDSSNLTIITGEGIDTGTITADNIATGAITAGKVAAGAITANELAAGSVTTDKIQAGAVTASQINTTGLIAENISAEEIYGKSIYGAYLEGAVIRNSWIDLSSTKYLTNWTLARDIESSGSIYYPYRENFAKNDDGTFTKDSEGFYRLPGITSGILLPDIPGYSITTEDAHSVTLNRGLKIPAYDSYKKASADRPVASNPRVIIPGWYNNPGSFYEIFRVAMYSPYHVEENPIILYVTVGNRDLQITLSGHNADDPSTTRVVDLGSNQTLLSVSTYDDETWRTYTVNGDWDLGDAQFCIRASAGGTHNWSICLRGTGSDTANSYWDLGNCEAKDGLDHEFAYVTRYVMSSAGGGSTDGGYYSITMPTHSGIEIQ